MCIAAWIWQCHPHYPLLLLFNRDEYHKRPTKPVAWWEDFSQILGGRDCLAGGTWLASTRNGRLAFLTNVMEPDQIPNARSRGELPVRFLESKKSPLDFAQEVIKEGDQYNGFNLIVADLCSKTMIYVSNRPKEEPFTIQEVSPGLHVLSNAKLDTPWHKVLYMIDGHWSNKCEYMTLVKKLIVKSHYELKRITRAAQRLRQNFNKLLHKYGEKEVSADEIVEQLMTDTVKADKKKLPNTGCEPEWEFMTSSIFFRIDTPLGHCGTRSMVALSVKTSGEVNFYEQYLEKNIWNSHTVQYHIENDLWIKDK